MSNQEYNKTVLETINKFRVNPMSFQKNLITMSKALIRAKQSNEGNELQEFANNLGSYSALEELNPSVGLQKTAEDQLLNIIKGKSKIGVMSDMKLKERCNYFTTSNDGAIESADHGDIDNLLSRMIISDFDPQRKVRAALLNAEYKHIGVASADFGDEPVSVVVFATDVVEIEEIDYGEDQELKDAFDLFDVYHTGKIDNKALIAAFEALGFNKDSYSVYKAIVAMEGGYKGKVANETEWPEFRDVIKAMVGDMETKEGLKSLFELFVDSPDQTKITVSTMNRVAKELQDDISYEELVKVMKRAANNNVDLDFEEFYKIMQNYKELHPETEA